MYVHQHEPSTVVVHHVPGAKKRAANTTCSVQLCQPAPCVNVFGLGAHVEKGDGARADEHDRERNKDGADVAGEPVGPALEPAKAAKDDATTSLQHLEEIGGRCKKLWHT